ncbi:MAG: phage tail protein [Oscillospiraceae bacterium]|nr:phage tail protein [Oscillospiraceae bacterium]
MPNTYPFTRFKYKVDFGGSEAGFSEITGFDASIDIVEYREGNMTPPTPIKLPGLRKYSNIVFKWGLTSSMDAYNWMSPSFETDIERKTVSVTLLNENGEEVATWQIVQAWPVKYTGPEFNATSSEVAIEQLELAHEGLTRTK